MKRSVFAFGSMIGGAILATAVLAPQPGQTGRGGQPNPLLQAFDTDRDGTLSSAEIDTRPQSSASVTPTRTANYRRELAARPGRPRRPGRSGPRPGGVEADSDLNKPALPKDDGEKRILAAIDQARAGERYANVSTADGRLLRQLAESIGAKRVVELGTSTGESGLWFALALRRPAAISLPTTSTPGGSASPARTSRRVASTTSSRSWRATPTRRRRRIPTRSTSCSSTPRRRGTMPISKELLPFVRPGGLILAHNMRRPAPNPRYVEAITTNRDLDTSFVLMDGAGLGITLKKR